MNREDVEKLTLGEGKMRDPVAGKPRKFPVIGLPTHLSAEIDGTVQGGYQYKLNRTGDFLVYRQNQFSRTPEASFQALRSLLNWDPVS
jgi:hypothetical protein